MEECNGGEQKAARRRRGRGTRGVRTCYKPHGLYRRGAPPACAGRAQHPRNVLWSSLFSQAGNRNVLCKLNKATERKATPRVLVLLGTPTASCSHPISSQSKKKPQTTAVISRETSQHPNFSAGINVSQRLLSTLKKN